MLQEYLLNSKWSDTLVVRCITSTACSSAGDALRELDAMGVIRSDPFILISGDVISNMDLKKAIEFHKEKRKEDNNAIMTVVLKQVQKSTGAKPILTDLVVGLDRLTSQMLLFEDNYKKSSVQIPLEIMAEHPGGLNFRTDLLDCHVDICSPELMLQFSDNFDYQARHIFLFLVSVLVKSIHYSRT
jgi:translation initiation factor eIF-2B subunit epsilon